MKNKHDQHRDEKCKCEEERMHECQCGDGGCGGGCDCHSGHHFVRRYHTKEEHFVMMENYLKELHLEIKAVEEQLQALRA
jgi:hypothetical protein